MKEIKKKYRITVDGCDDETTIVKELTVKEFKLIQSIAYEITETSNSQCMPRMEIKEKRNEIN